MLLEGGSHGIIQSFIVDCKGKDRDLLDYWLSGRAARITLCLNNAPDRCKHLFPGVRIHRTHVDFYLCLIGNDILCLASLKTRDYF